MHDDDGQTDIQAREAQHVLQTYRRAADHVRARPGASVCTTPTDASISTCCPASASPSLGHAHPGWRAAIADQAQTLIHTSNLFYHPLQGQLAERLAALSGLPRAFFCNSGTEAVEACLKFARRYWYTRGEPRTEIVALEDRSTAGRWARCRSPRTSTIATPFEPLLGRRHVRAGERSGRAARRRVDRTTAAIIAEPIQGEGGVRPLTPAFAARDQRRLRANRRAAHRRRSAVRARPHRAPVLLRGARPASRTSSRSARRSAAACRSARRWSARRSRRRSSSGDHGSTYGGNLLACRAALCVLDELVGRRTARERT